MNIKTHVNIPFDLTKSKYKVDLNNDSIGYVEQYDFSKSNISEEARIAAITTIASVCYQNPKALGSIKLYDRLAMENKGLPSSSYEFVPILLTSEQVVNISNYIALELNNIHIIKFGEWVNGIGENDQYLLTNLRALIHDIGDDANKAEYYNTSEEEILIIKKNFKVFKQEIDLVTARQFIRHRMSPQELSRRYVSGNKKEFSFYISEGMKDVTSKHELTTFDGSTVQVNLNTEQLFDICLKHYQEALKQVIDENKKIIKKACKPEEARRCIPQAMYTTIWAAWQPRQLEVFFKLRLDKHAQKEIRELAEAKKLILEKEKLEIENCIVDEKLLKCKSAKCDFLIKNNEIYSCGGTGSNLPNIENCMFWDK